uniref:Uncharacterized protein n=1 Tax=Glossina pallidipes TaxID=7398 RepID=A0A1B0AF07_GLOPL
MVRWKSGVAASLNYLDLDSEDQSPKVTPYPGWEANTILLMPTDDTESLLKYNSTIVDSNRSEYDKTYAYLADSGTYTFIVYSFHDNRSYRIARHYFHFDPLQGDFNVGGVNFQWTDGIFGMTTRPTIAE